jgi:hypothetical protein
VIPSSNCPFVAGRAGPSGDEDGLDAGAREALTDGFGAAVSAPRPPSPPFTAYAPTGTAASAISAAPVTATRRRRSASPCRRIAG